MSHELVKSYATGEYRMAYRMRTDSDRPWHDDHTHCKRWLTPPTIPEVLHDLEAYVDIVMRPLFDVNGQQVAEVREVWRPHCDTTGKVMSDELARDLGVRLGVVGLQYTLIQDREVVEWFGPWVDSGAMEIETGGAILGGSRFWVLGKITKDPVEIVKDDPVEQYILAMNGHDGKVSFCAFPTTIRVVCNNTLVMALRDSFSRKYRVRHNHLVHAKLSEIRSDLNQLHNLFVRQTNQMKELAKVTVPSEQDLKVYFQKVLGKEEQPDLELNMESTRPLVQMMKLFEEGTGQDLPGVKDTWWAAFNAVTEFSTHLRGKNSDHRLDNMISGIGQVLNTRALEFGLLAAVGNLTT